MISIKTKIAVLTSLVIGLLFTAFGVYIDHQVRRANLDKVDTRLVALSQRMRDEIDEQTEEHHPLDHAAFSRLSAEILPLARIRLTDSLQTIVYEDSLLRSVSLKTELHPTQEAHFKTVKVHGDHYRCLSRQVEIDKQGGWMLQVLAPLSDVEASLGQLRLLLWTAIPVALIFSLFMVNLIVRRAFRPLTAMIETANRISTSTLNERLAPQLGRDEVSRLGASLNRMIDRLEMGFKSQKQFIADASHELRTPLTIIQSELEYATRSSMPEAAHQSVQIALDELDRLRKLSGDLLMLAKLDSAGSAHLFHPVRLDEVVAECVQRQTRIAATKDVTIRLNVTDAVELPADEEKLRSAVMNLLENALKFTPAGGTITVTLARRNARVTITVHDTGRGIHPRDIPHIFKPFYRSDLSRSDTKGSGLGLSIVQRIAEFHRGTVSVQSDGSTGSTFTLELPVLPFPSSPESTHPD